MAGAAKRRANQERQAHVGNNPNGSSSRETSSSGKPSGSARSHPTTARSARSARSEVSRQGGMDGNRDPDAGDVRNPATQRVTVNPKNLDLGVVQWSTVRGYTLPTKLPKREPPSKLGAEAKIGLNTFKVEKVPTNKVYQFDVSIGDGNEKPGLINKVWQSKAVNQAVGNGWIFDGNKLAWAMKPIERDIKLIVDLDQEDNRPPRADGKKNQHRVYIRQTNVVGLETLMAYLENKATWDNKCLEAITFLDHLLREYPRLRYTSIKRSFFARGQQRTDLGRSVEAFKGVYQSMRIAHGPSGAHLSINLDVANGTFWTESYVHDAATRMANMNSVINLVQAVQKGGEKGAAGVALKKLRKVRVIANHRGTEPQEYVMEKFIFASAREYRIERDNQQVTLYEYLARRYNIRLQHPDLPLVKMTRGKNTVLPMEVLKIKQNQRYPFKLDERQTSEMIKFAVTPPPKRWEAIQHGLNMLDWAKDPHLQAFGMKINPNKTLVSGRVLTAPTVKFGMGEAKPGTSGRWDLKGKKFLQANTVELKSWGVCVVPGRRGGKPDKAAVDNFIREFVKIYRSHGGKVSNETPSMTLSSGDDVGSWVTTIWNQTGNQANMRPQILIFILPDKDATTYGRIKRSGECRYGVVTQCMQYTHVLKAAPQYISNVCMKFNAKLGGKTSRAVGTNKGQFGVFKVPTMIIGADVSHAAPGAQTPSMAAVTMSMDYECIRYGAACQTNGFRVEMIMTDNINEMLGPLFRWWVKNVHGGKLPGQIIYFRDGVSEGQYQHVIEQEIRDISALVGRESNKLKIPITAIVGSKRHHVRFFPERGDRNGNPFPGTLVETGVTHPFENDFYLSSHAAIKGTARPAHYQVILNEAGLSNDEIHTMIYEHCYQYIRATTPISQHPAIYYAHLVSNRAIPHDPKWGGSTSGQESSDKRPRSGSQSKSQGMGKGQTGPSSGQIQTEYEKLMPMPNQGGINAAMWYV